VVKSKGRQPKGSRAFTAPNQKVPESKNLK